LQIEVRQQFFFGGGAHRRAPRAGLDFVRPVFVGFGRTSFDLGFTRVRRRFVLCFTSRLWFRLWFRFPFSLLVSDFASAPVSALVSPFASPLVARPSPPARRRRDYAFDLCRF
jgi:hypothetical protein